MKQVVAIALAAVSTAASAITEASLAALSRVPGLPDFRSVDYAVNGFEKVRRRLDAAQEVNIARAQRFGELADRYDELAEAAEYEADRARNVQVKISKLLD